MIINEDKKFIFIHVFRTGGTSIDWAFGRRQMHDTHQRLETIPNWQDYFSFSTIRNPWDRMVSAYKYLSQTKKFMGTFEDYVQTFAVGKLRTKKKYAQHDMVKNCSYIMRFEHLQEDFKDVCNIIGIDPPSLEQIWKTNHKPYNELFTEEMKEIVANACSGDIEEYGFTFEGPATKNIGDRRR